MLHENPRCSTSIDPQGAETCKKGAPTRGAPTSYDEFT